MYAGVLRVLSEMSQREVYCVLREYLLEKNIKYCTSTC